MNALTAIVLILPYVAALLFAIAELRGRLPARAPRTPALAPWVWIVALIVTYAVQLAAIRYAATNLTHAVAWRLAMPFPVADVDMLHPDAVAAIYIACAAVQSYALLALYRCRPSQRAVVAGLGGPSGDVFGRAGSRKFRCLRLRAQRHSRPPVVYAAGPAIPG